MPKLPNALLIPVVIIALEALVLWGFGIWSIVALLQNDNTSFVSALFLIGLVLAAALWASNIALGLAKLKRRSHTPGLILQLLVASIATASFGGEFGNLIVGFALLIPSAAAFFLLFSAKVRGLFQRD